MILFQKEADREHAEAHKEIVKDWILRYAEQSSESSGEDPEEEEDPVSCALLHLFSEDLKLKEASAVCIANVTY